MVYLIESQQAISFATLGNVVLEALKDLDEDMGADFRTQSIDPVVVKSTRDYDEWVIGKFEYGFDKDLGFPQTSDSVMVYRMKSLRGIFNEDFALSLIQEGIRPSLVVIPGLGETCPVNQKGMFYMNPTNDSKFHAYLVGRSIQRRIPEVDKVWYCCLNPKGRPELISVK